MDQYWKPELTEIRQQLSDVASRLFRFSQDYVLSNADKSNTLVEAKLKLSDVETLLLKIWSD